MGLSAGKKVVPFEQRLQHRLQAVLEAMPVAVSWATLQDQKIEFLNRKFIEMSGYVPGDHPMVQHWTGLPNRRAFAGGRGRWSR